MSDNKPLPFGKDRRGVGKKGEESLQAYQLGRCLVGRVSKPVGGRRPRGYCPQLVQHLRDKTGSVSSYPQGSDGVKHYLVLSVTDLNHPAEDVRVEKDLHVRSG